MATQNNLNPGDTFELTLLEGSKPVGSGSVIEMVGPQLRAQVPLNLPFGSAVKLECGDLMILGDACHSEPHDDGYIVTITARHVTVGLPGLQHLYRAVGQSHPVTETAQERVPSLLNPATN